MDLELAGNYRGELLRARLARTVSADDLAFLYPGYPKDAPTTLAAIYRQLPLRQRREACSSLLAAVLSASSSSVATVHPAPKVPASNPLRANSAILETRSMESPFTKLRGVLEPKGAAPR